MEWFCVTKEKRGKPQQFMGFCTYLYVHSVLYWTHMEAQALYFSFDYQLSPTSIHYLFKTSLLHLWWKEWDIFNILYIWRGLIFHLHVLFWVGITWVLANWAKVVFQSFKIKGEVWVPVKWMRVLLSLCIHKILLSTTSFSHRKCLTSRHPTGNMMTISLNSDYSAWNIALIGRRPWGLILKIVTVPNHANNPI